MKSFVLAALCFSAALYAKNPETLRVEPYLTPDMMTLQPLADYQAFELVVVGPDGFQHRVSFDGAAVPYFEVYNGLGEVLADGLYTFELRATPHLSDELRARMQRNAGDMAARAKLMPALPKADLAMDGAFRIHNGSILLPQTEQPTLTFETQNGREEGTFPGNPILTPDDNGTVGGDRFDDPSRQVINGDLIVYNSACIGFDCVNPEAFGSDTLRLKENNMRIHFDDTSGGTFPANDWRIVANDSANGGASYLAFEDSTNGRITFRVTAGAPANSLFVDAQGDVGFGTSTPLVELHTVDGDTPTLRLEQNGSSGFGPQTWDVAGNETNFFVRDVSNGSALPFRIRGGAPDDAIYIDNDDQIGLYTSAPSASLHLRRTDGTANVLIEDAGTAQANRTLLSLKNNGGTAMSYQNDAANGGAGIVWTVSALGNNSMTWNNNTNGGTELTLTGAGDLTALGAVNGGSDVHMKENFEEVSTRDVLSRLLELPVTEWNYIKDSQDVRHLGPMAQDFYAAFGLGASERTIGVLDASGVTIASIQALHEIVTDEMAAKDAKIKALEQRLADLEAKLNDQ